MVGVTSVRCPCPTMNRVFIHFYAGKGGGPLSSKVASILGQDRTQLKVRLLSKHVAGGGRR